MSNTLNVSSDTTKPLCECHGEPMLWKKDKRVNGKGYWTCLVRKREKQYVSETAGAGFIPAAPVHRIIQEWVTRQAFEPASDGRKGSVQQLGPVKVLQFRTGLKDLAKQVSGNRRWIHFDVADKIISAIDVMLWHTDKDLREIYQSFDLERLDKKRPVTKS